MPYTKKSRPYKKEYEQQKERGEHDNRMERQRARRAMDKKGGSNGDGVRLQSPSKNRAAGGALSKPPKSRKK
jgi:hypothetical protein